MARRKPTVSHKAPVPAPASQGGDEEEDVIALPARKGVTPWHVLPGRIETSYALRRLVSIHRAGRTDEQIALAAGQPKQWLSRLLTGRIPNPGVSTVERLLAVLGATWTDFDREGRRED